MAILEYLKKFLKHSICLKNYSCERRESVEESEKKTIKGWEMRDRYAWLKALIKEGDFRSGELLATKMEPDFGKIDSYLIISGAYFKLGKQEDSYAWAAKAATL